MELYDVILIGVALSMDACALTIANCTTYKCSLDGKKEWLMPTAFALFQGIMPLIGYFIGSLFANTIGEFGNYITALIFFILSGKIIFDIIKEKKSCDCQKPSEKPHHNFTLPILLLQALATSIDALAVGVTLISLTFSVFIAVAIISAVTFILVAIALLCGKSLGKLFGEYAEWVGAIILFILAIKSLVTAII